MLTAFIRGLAERFLEWADHLPEAPFEGKLTHAALALAETSAADLAAEIGVLPDQVEAYAKHGPCALDQVQRDRLRRFFAARGVFERCSLFGSRRAVGVRRESLFRHALQRELDTGRFRRLFDLQDRRSRH